MISCTCKISVCRYLYGNMSHELYMDFFHQDIDSHVLLYFPAETIIQGLRFHIVVCEVRKVRKNTQEFCSMVFFRAGTR